MIKLMKKHYMPFIAVMIFVSVFLYQFFSLLQIPVLIQYSLEEVDYLSLFVYVSILLTVVSLVYNVFLLLTIEVSQVFKLPFIREISLGHYNYSNKYKRIHFVINRYKRYSVFRC